MQKIFKQTLIFFLTGALLAGLTAVPVFAYEVNKSAIVLLVARDRAQQVLGTGSGFIVKPDGTLITNYHVLVDAASVDAVFQSGNTVPITGVLKVDRTKDFAILKLKDDNYSTLELGDSTRIQEFDYTSALGYLSESVNLERGGMRGSLLQTYGFALGIASQADPGFSYIYTTTTFGSGFSGGPVINRENKVLGVATIDGRALNLALPIHYIKPHLDTNRLESKTLMQLLEEDKHSLEARYYRGNSLLYGMGDAEGASREFEGILKKKPDFILARYDLAAAYRNLGEMDRSIAEYEKVVKLNPKFPEALSNLGGYYFRRGNINNAVHMFQRAVEAHPNFIQALSNLGAALNKLERYQEAVVPLEKTLRINPEFGVAHFNLGNAYFGMNDLVMARSSYEIAVSLGIDFLSLHWKLYRIYLKQGHNQKAADQLRTILQIDPQNLEAQKKLRELGPP